MPKNESDQSHHTDAESLKVRSPRLEQNVFHLTPSGRPDRPDARRLNQRKKSGRATTDDNPTDSPGEQIALGEVSDE
jgi:hypothetical protein